MKKITLTRKFNPSTNEYDDVNAEVHYSSITHIFTKKNQLEIHTNHDIYIHRHDSNLLHELHRDEGFHWQHDCLLINMNSMEKHSESRSHDLPYFSKDMSTHEQFHGDSASSHYSLFYNNPYPICIVDSQCILVDMNPTMSKFVGRDRSQYIYQPVRNFILPEHSGLVDEAFIQVLQGNSQTLELHFTEQSGQLLMLHVTCIPINGPHQVEGVFVLLREMSDEKKAQEMLIRSEKLSIVGQMAAGIAHEIRNPLTSLKGFSQLLKNKAPQYTDYLNIMLTELERINFIVSELLVVSKPQVVNLQYINIQDTLFNTIELLNTQAILNNVVLQFQPVESIPLIRCDENQLKQVFINLFTNGIDAMPYGGKVTVDIENPDPQHLVITFKDHGIGIPKERIPRLGEPFYSTKEKGTGLGLMVSFQIIQFHKGHIHIDSTLGVGTTIIITLPIMGP
jgi:two-component system, sporulation sensor kinase E